MKPGDVADDQLCLVRRTSGDTGPAYRRSEVFQQKDVRACLGVNVAIVTGRSWQRCQARSLDRNGLLVHKQISSQDGCASQVWSRETLRLSTAALLNYADHRAGSVWKAARKNRYFLPAARYRPR